MPRREETRATRQQLLEAAEKYIRRHVTDPDLSLDEVATAIGTSPRQLQRVFAELAPDESFRDYLLRIRMQLALELVTRTPPVPSRIAAGKVGYRGSSGFRQAFRRYYGKNPSAFHPPRPPVPGIDIPPRTA